VTGNDHLRATVVDAATGEPLEGVPTRILFVEARMSAPTPVYARHHEGSWVQVQSRHLGWHRAMGHDVRLVLVRDESEQLEANRV
jgi:hypothetical protein